jgi:hypothetical protein
MHIEAPHPGHRHLALSEATNPATPAARIASRFSITLNLYLLL